MNKVDAVILAGAQADFEMAPNGEQISRAMIQIGDKTMLQWVVDALRASSSIGKIIAVGNVTADGLDGVLEPGDSMVNNIRSGVESLDTESPVLIVSSDIPLLTAEAVDDFIGRALAIDVDLAYPIIPRAHCEARYPGLKRTYLKTGDGVFTGGNIMLVKHDFIANHWNAIADAYGARKQIFKLASMIGVGVLIRAIIAQVLPGVLRVSMLERAISKMLNARLQSVVSAYPEIGEDVDKPSDLAFVQKLLV